MQVMSFNCGCPYHGPQSQGGCTRETAPGADRCKLCEHQKCYRCPVCFRDNDGCICEDPNS